MTQSFLQRFGLLVATCFVSNLGFSAVQVDDEEFAYSLDPLKRDDSLLSTIWEPEEEPFSLPQKQSVRDASVLFSLDHLIEEKPEIYSPPPLEPRVEKPEDLPKSLPQNAPAETPRIPHPPQIVPPTISEPKGANKLAQTPSTANGEREASTPVNAQEASKKILINFNNVGIIEYIRFISRISNRNFVFDEADLQFNVTIISEEPTTIENIMAALIQELRIHDLTLIEQGNNLIIHKNLKVNSVSKVVADDLPGSSERDSEIVTQVFRLNTLDPTKAAAVIRPLVSDRALVESLRETNHLIVTDVVSNVNQISDLLKSLDAPNSGLVIGQYVARTADIDMLLPLVQKLMQPISQDQPLSFVPYSHTNSIFIVSTPFLVERSISILQHLDQEKGKTRIIELRELKFERGGPTTGAPTPVKPVEVIKPMPEIKPIPVPGVTFAGIPLESGWEFGPTRVDFQEERERAIQKATRAAQERAEAAAPHREGVNILPLFIPVEMPPQIQIREILVKEECPPVTPPPPPPPPPLHVGVTVIDEDENGVIPIEKLSRPVEMNNEVAPVPVGRSKFYIHKLQYRSGDVILGQIQQIAQSLQNARGNEDFLAAIGTIQWLQDAKALVITATPDTIEKIRELIEQLDIPLRQVFIEMLILQTTVDDSLEYGVNWGTRFAGGNQAGSMGFQEGPSTLQGTLDTTGVTGLGGIRPNTSDVIPFNNALIPDPTNLAKAVGFKLGIIGQHIVHKGLGLEFNSIGALVSAIHNMSDNNVVLSPKIITEDGVPAQIFVGINTPFKTQSVSNDEGSIVTNNFVFQDVGTSLMVTPHITNGDIISLDILEEFSSLQGAPVTTGNSNEVVGPTTNKNSTKTSLLVPDGFFVIMSGMIQEQETLDRQQIPCLGSLPLAGAAFSHTAPANRKRNLMIFIRPQIIDTDEQIQNITRHQQDVWKIKNEVKPAWEVETETALDYFNVRSTFNTDDEDDLPCREFVH